MTAALEGVSGQQHVPAALYPREKTRYPFYRRLGGPQGRSGRGENLVPHRNSIPDRPARSQSLNRLSYPVHILFPYAGLLTGLYTVTRNIYIYTYFWQKSKFSEVDMILKTNGLKQTSQRAAGKVNCLVLWLQDANRQNTEPQTFEIHLLQPSQLHVTAQTSRSSECILYRRWPSDSLSMERLKFRAKKNGS